MPQSLNQKAVNNFVKGLITESGELTFPDGASVDELNCDLRRDGTRRRRLGVALEDNYQLSTDLLGDSEVTATGTWINVGGNSELEFLVFQKGTTLYFYNKASLPYSAQIETNTVNLLDHEFTGSAGAGSVRCQFTTIQGKLVVSSPAINTIVIEYNAGTFTPTEISFKVRDFDWQGDTSTYYEDDSTPSQDRKYDAQNTGWNTGNGSPTDLTKRLTHPWYSGKDSNDVYSATEFDKVYGGTTLAGNGHYILDFFTKDRATASGLTGLTNATETETTRFRCAEAFSGRVFYAGLDSEDNAGTILFSPIVETKDDLGVCHQQNDPTSEYLPDLLDTDGGEIKIPDAVKILKLYSYQNSLFVFADNGVWQITGIDGYFKASSYVVGRVSRIGILNPESFVEAEGIPFWWSRFGIHTLTADQVSGTAKEQNLSISTIQTFWDNIDGDAKAKATGVYDSINKRIFWGYPDAGETVESKINNFLILDIPLQAFYPWRVEDQASSTNAIVGLTFYSGFGAEELELDVTSNSGVDDVVTSAGDDVVSTQVSTFNTGDPAIVLICRDGATNKFTLGGFTSKDFVDWGDTNYSSYAVTGYDFAGDLVLKKTAPYVVTYNRLTEEGFELDGQGDYTAIRPSSMLVSVAWDFKETFSQTQQAYRLKYPVVVDPNNLSVYDYPEDVITSRLKVRGKGRSLRLKYESEEGKDFILLGWGLITGSNPRF